MFVSTNIRLEGKAISDRWIRKLNQKDKGVCTFESSIKNLYAIIRTKCEQVQQNKTNVIFSLSVDAIKVLKSLNVNLDRKCIIGRSYPNHMISTQYLGKDCARKILDNNCDDNEQVIELASEVKIVVIFF